MLRASRSRIAFVYSVRFSRCRPGAGRCASAFLSISFSNQATSASRASLSSVGPPSAGGISPARSLRMTFSQVSASAATASKRQRLQVQARDLLGRVVAVEAIPANDARLPLAFIADQAAAGRKHARQRGRYEWSGPQNSSVHQTGSPRKQGDTFGRSDAPDSHNDREKTVSSGPYPARYSAGLTYLYSVRRASTVEPRARRTARPSSSDAIPTSGPLPDRRR